jgi:hypothetical protein
MLEFVETEAEEYESTWIEAAHDAAGKLLREVLPSKITLEIFRHHFDPIVPDHLLTTKHCPLCSIQRWVGGLNRLPKEFLLDPWHFGKVCQIIFDKYNTAVEIDLSNTYYN